MVRRIVILLLLATGGYLVYDNRQFFGFIAGLNSNKVRIVGEWYEVVHEFKEADVFFFSEGIIQRNDDNYASYYFPSYAELVVTAVSGPITYRVEFPDEQTMDWYREIKGEMTLVKKWAR